jgi:hypothetical protein
MLLTAFLICGVQDVSYGGELFWGLGEAFGAGLVAAEEGIGAGFGAVGKGLGAAGEGLGTAWEAFDVVGDAFGVHPIEIIATGGTTVIFRLIQLPDASIRGHVRGASNIFVLPDSGRIGIVVSGSVYFWDSHAEQFAAPLIHGAPIFNFVVSPDGGMLATTSEDGNVEFWARDPANTDTPWAPSGRQLDMSVVGHTTWAQLKLEPKIHILSTAFSPNGEILAGGSARGTVRLWNAMTGGIRTTLHGHSDTVTSVTFSPDGEMLATASADGTVRLWDPRTGDHRTTFSGHTGSVLSVASHPLNGLLASASIDGTVRLWNLNTGEQGATLDHESPVLDIAFSPDGEVLASANINGSVRLWDPETSRVHALLGHGSPVTTVAFGADKHTIITGSKDGRIRQWEVWDAVDSAPDILTVSTKSPLTERSIHGNVVTLTLSRLAYARSVFDDAIHVTGIPGVTFDNFFDVDRVSDTEVTVELKFNGNIDTDANLTFTVEADAVPGYFGPPLTAQMPVTAFTESVTASIASPLTEATLDGSVVTLTLDGRAYARSRVDIGKAVKVSGVPGVTVEWSDVDRLSDTDITVKLRFNGDLDTDAVLTFSVGARAIAGYGGSSLTAQLPVTGAMESVTVATTSPLTERTMDGSVVTLTLNGRDYAHSIYDIRDAVKVTGINGVTLPGRGIDRKSDMEIDLRLEFNGDIDEDATLTFTVGTDAIAGYNGTALTAQPPVGAFTESVSASTAFPLKESALEGSIVTLTLSGSTYEQSIRDAISVSGIDGAAIDKSNTKRISDTKAAVGIQFNGNMNVDGTLTLAVGAGAIEGYSGTALTTQLPVTASTETLTASTPSPLTEATLEGSVVTLALDGRTSYTQVVGDAVNVAGVAGVTMPRRGIDRKSDTEITFELEYNGDIDTDSTLTISVAADGIAGYGGPALTAKLSVTAFAESVAASVESPLIESTLNGSVVTLLLAGRAYTESIQDIRRALKLSEIAGATVDESDTTRVSDTAVAVAIEFNGNIDADADLTFSVGKDAVANYNGPALTAQLPVTASIESVTVSTTFPLTEATLDESVATLTLSGRNYVGHASDISRALTITGIDGVKKGSVRRMSDTEATVELEFLGDFDTDANLTFTIGPDAIAGYNGPAFTQHIPVTSRTETVSASTNAPLSETTLDNSVIKLTLSGRNFVSSSWDISRALTITGIDGVKKGSVHRMSDTEATVELEFNGDFDADATITLTVGPGAIANYNGPTFTLQILVVGGPESVAASTATPLTETTLDKVVVTLTLSGRDFVYSGGDILRALTITGIDGVTTDSVHRNSHTEANVELEFKGDFDADTALTITVGSEAIAGYNGPALATQLPVAGGPESIIASTDTWLTEATLDNAVIALTLSGREYAPYSTDILYALTITGIEGVTKGTVRRISDTEATVKLKFEGDFEIDAILTFTVDPGAIANYNGPPFIQQLPVAGGQESVVASTPAWLTEATLDKAVVALTLSGRDYVSSRWDISQALTVTGIDGVTRDAVRLISNTEVIVELGFEGDFDIDEILIFTVRRGAIVSYNGPALTAALRVASVQESLVASTRIPLTEATLDKAVVALTLSGRNYIIYSWDISSALTIAGIDGVTKRSVRRNSDTEATVELDFKGDFDANAALTFTLRPEAIENYNGPALTAQIPVTAMIEDDLAANFPNPFNPETWIPYQLAADADVTLTIHALDGQLVRHLVLGYQIAGTYYSRSRAAYWDGKNDFGETVASGVYFYTLTAGDFSATRKMLIRK